MVPPGSHLDLVALVPIWGSPVTGSSGLHLASPNTMTLIHIWAPPGPVDSGPYLGIIGIWILSYIPGPNLELVTVVPLGLTLSLIHI